MGGGGDLLSKSWNTISYDTPLKKMEENYKISKLTEIK